MSDPLLNLSFELRRNYPNAVVYSERSRLILLDPLLGRIVFNLYLGCRVKVYRGSSVTSAAVGWGCAIGFLGYYDLRLRRWHSRKLRGKPEYKGLLDAMEHATTPCSLRFITEEREKVSGSP
jgi:hypothetical protein